jgi:hypothetical protein
VTAVSTVPLPPRDTVAGIDARLERCRRELDAASNIRRPRERIEAEIDTLLDERLKITATA